MLFFTECVYSSHQFWHKLCVLSGPRQFWAGMAQVDGTLMGPLTALQRSKTTGEGDLEKAESGSLKDKTPNLKVPCSLEFHETMGQRQMCCWGKGDKARGQDKGDHPWHLLLYHQ